MRYVWILTICLVPGCDLARNILPGGPAPVSEVAPALVQEPAETLVSDSAISDVADAPPAGSSVPDPTLPPPSGFGSVLGTTVASLGDPAEGGMWLKTPLVREQRAGQVSYRGAVVAVTLQPLDLPVGSGSQISVRAMQALGASLGDLVEVTVEVI